MSDTHLNVYLGKNLKSRWVSYCKQKGLAVGAPVKEAINRQLEKEAPLFSETNQIIYKQIEDIDVQVKRRKEIKLTQSEDDAITSRSEAENSSPQAFIINAIRATLTNEPQFTTDAIKALWESSTQLRIIGRNLNQIAKKINLDDKVSDISMVQMVVDLEKQINKHTERVSLLVAASVDRWTLKKVK